MKCEIVNGFKRVDIKKLISRYAINLNNNELMRGHTFRNIFDFNRIEYNENTTIEIVKINGNNLDRIDTNLMTILDNNIMTII